MPKAKLLTFFILFSILATAFLMNVAIADDNTFQPSTADNHLHEAYPDTNYGNQFFLLLQSYSGALKNVRPILKFDLSGDISQGSVINSATLSLYYYYKGSNNPSGRTYMCYRVTQTAWTEGNGALGSTWNEYDDGSSWTNAGGDYTTDDEASTTVPSSYGWMEWNVTDQVQYAIDSVSGIAHFLIRDETEDSATQYYVWFHSKEWALINPSQCPKLYVEWTSGTQQHSADLSSSVNMGFNVDTQTNYNIDLGSTVTTTWNILAGIQYTADLTATITITTIVNVVSGLPTAVNKGIYFLLTIIIAIPILVALQTKHKKRGNEK